MPNSPATFTIKDVAKHTQLSAKQIRDYEKQGLLPNVSRSMSGYRLYYKQDIERLQFIYHARQVGFSLADIAELLALQDNPNRLSRDVKALTARHIDELDNQIQQLQTMKATLQTWHDSCHGDGSAQCSILDGLMTGDNTKTHTCHAH